MTNISQSQFRQSLQHGVDLSNPELRGQLERAGVGVEGLARLDTNGDGELTGREIDAAFKYVDDFDRNGSARSFRDEGTAGQIYAALKAGKKEGPYFGAAIHRAALDRANADSEGYAFENAPTSPYRNLSGNKTPGTSRPSWLKNNNKCNQFVGDALTQAGMRMPTFTMKDGTEHYVNAERLPDYKKHFDRITDLSDIRPGDVFVNDYPGSGLSTAHTEVISSYDPATGTLRSVGAHADGAYESDQSHLLKDAKLNREGGYWEHPSGNKFYVLRPKMQANPPKVPIRP